MKQSDAKHQPGKKHQGVRPGSTATRKERHQVENREPIIDEERSKWNQLEPADRSETDQSAKRAKRPAAKKSREVSPEKRSRLKDGTGKKNLYANMPKARKVR